jgi:hypothetical protein
MNADAGSTAGERQVIDVTNIGQALLDQGFLNATGTGKQTVADDDYGALQRLIDPSTIPPAERNPPGSPPPPQPGTLYFPPGRYRITQTLKFPNQTGHHLVGCGMAQRAPCDIPTYETSNRGMRSVILWDGPIGGTMIEYTGTGLVWDGLTLWGSYATGDPNCPVPQDNPRAGIGIKITTPATGSLLNAGKIWFPAIMIDNCGTGIYADGSSGGLSADSCAFGYGNFRLCGTCVRLDGAGATTFTFEYTMPQLCEVMFHVTGGGRVYVQSLNLLLNPTGGTILDVSGGDLTNSFFHINGLTGDGRTADYHLLNNVDNGNGLTHVRFTNAHFISAPGGANVAKINIDRTKVGGGSSGQTVVEIVGSRGLAVNAGAFTNNVTIKGASSSERSRLIVRDCDIARFPGDPPTSQLIKQPDSSNYTENRIKNWVFGAGLQPSEFESG